MRWTASIVLVCAILLPACSEPTTFDDGCLVDFVPQGPTGASGNVVAAADSATVDSGNGTVGCLPLNAQSKHGADPAAIP